MMIRLSRSLQGKGKARAAQRAVGFGPHLPPLSLDEPPHDGQSQPCAAQVPVSRAVAPVKALPNPLGVVSEPRTAVVDDHNDLLQAILPLGRGVAQTAAPLVPPVSQRAGRIAGKRSEERRVGKECSSRWAP